MSLLEVDGVTTAYGHVVALSNVSIKVAQGDVVCVLGANGAGKSTLLKSVMGIAPVSSGRITFDGQDITGKLTAEIVSGGITLCPEGRRLFPAMSVLENIKMGAYTVADHAGTRRRLAMIHDLFPRLQERRSQAAGSLSGGEQQMVAIARALMSNPRLLLLDEPTLGLAPKVIQEIASIVSRISTEGITVVLVEQNAKLALKISTVGYVLETGCVALCGPAEDLLADGHVRRIYLGG